MATRPSALGCMVSPVTGNDVGLRRAEIKQGMREVILCKDQDGKVGLRLRNVDNVSTPAQPVKFCKTLHLFYSFARSSLLQFQ